MRSAARLRFVTPEERHIADLVANLRDADRAEVVASHGPDVRRTLDQALAISTHLEALESDAGVLCVFGCAPRSLIGLIGSPWMLGTDRLDRAPCTLMKGARRYFAEVERAYPILENWVDARHAASIVLLEWLGCSFDEPRPYGHAGLPFIRFERRSS